MSMESPEGKERLPVTLQAAGEQDIEQLIEIEKSVAGQRTYSPMLTAEDWTEELEKGHVYFIKQGEKVVGNISYEERPEDSLYISGVIVLPEFQGHGIGRTALQHVLDQYQHAKRIELVTHPDNPALKLYESLGFKIESRNEDYWGEGEPRLLLALTRKE